MTNELGIYILVDSGFYLLHINSFEKGMNPPFFIYLFNLRSNRRKEIFPDVLR